MHVVILHTKIIEIQLIISDKTEKYPTWTFFNVATME
jgi:hypothetical protein